MTWRAAWPRALLAGAVLLPLAAFAVGPVLLLLARIGGTPGIALAELLEPAAREALVNSVVTSAGAAAVALLVGLPLSFLLYRTDLPGREALAALFTSTLAVPPFIWGMGWISLANPSAGLLNRLADTPWLDIYGRVGIAFVLGTSGMPLVLVAARAALLRIDSALEEAARMCGASAWRAVATATLPLVLPAALSGAVLVFLFAASAFGVPYMLGTAAATPTPVLTTRIYAHVLLGGEQGLGRALALAALLLVLATIVLGLSHVLGRAGRVRLAAGKGVRASPMRLGRARRPLLGLVALVAVVTVVLPLGAIAFTSVQRSFGAALGWDNLTMGHWESVLLSPRTGRAAANSLALAGAAGLAVCALGLGVALVRRRAGRAGRLVELAAAWPYAVPGTVLAMALLVAYSLHWRLVVAERVAFVLALANTSWLLLVAYGAKYLALGSRTLIESLEQLDPSLAEAARMSGAGPARAFADTVLPLLKPALAGAFVLTFMLCATELTMSVLLVPPGGDVLGTLLFELQTYADPAAASVLACSFVLLIFTALGLQAWARPRSGAI